MAKAPCAVCTRPIVINKKSLPPGRATCHPCRGKRREQQAQQCPPRRWTCDICGVGLVGRGAHGRRCAEHIGLTLMQCGHCGIADARPFGALYCNNCTERGVWKHRVKSTALVVYRAPARTAPINRIPRRPGRWVSGPCKICRKSFVSRDRRHVACSAECYAVHLAILKRGYHQHRGYKERAEQYGVAYEYVNKQNVFRRDRWVCGICRKKVDRRLSYPHPRSVSLDHVIPLSRGGEHSYVNVQCSHLVCNLEKSNAGGGEQLALIG